MTRAAHNRIELVVENKAVELYQKGLSLQEIAKDLGIGTGTAYRALKRRGITLRNPHMFIPDDNIETIREMIDQGIGIRAIAKKLKASPVTIQNTMKENGIESKHKFGEGGSNHSSFKGGRNVNMQGYVEVLLDQLDPMTPFMGNKSGYVLEHRLVLARSLGRPLARYESVHHINGDRQDNRPENLQLRVGKHGTGVTYYCADCGSKNIVPCELD